MCGRFTLNKPKQELVELFSADGTIVELLPRYNIAPSQLIAVVGLKPDGIHRGLIELQWGLVPNWSEVPSTGFRPINARAETVHSLPTFRQCFAEKRCLIPADGFYEWKKDGKAKQPYHIRMKDRRAFAFAGLWDVWKGDDQIIRSACLITTTPNELTRTVHDRMPVIIPPDQYEAWLSHDTSIPQLRSMLKPYPAEEMEAVPVNKLVNSAKVDSPDCLTVQAV